MLTNDNLTAVLYGINDLRLEQSRIDEPDSDEVLLKVACVGICGSDLHYLLKGRIGNFIVDKPMIIGHESSGTVIKTGKNVRNLKMGDKVAIEPGIPCRICEFCKTGRYNLCADVKFCATPPTHGSLRRFYKHPADFCYKLPDNVSLEEGALLEPLSVGVHACKKAGVGIGSNVLIFGAGPIGLVTLLTAKAMGARTIIIADVKQYRLDIAGQLGADALYCIRDGTTEEENLYNLKKIFNEQPNITIDASGAESSIRLAILVTKTGGTVVLVGMGESEIKIPLTHALVREIDIKSVFRYAHDYSDALDLVSRKKVNVGAIVTHRYKLEQTLEAFEASKSSQSGAVKVIINCD